MDLDDLEPWALELVRSARVGRLGYRDAGGLPRVLPVTFTVWQGALWSAIDHKRKSRAEPARLRHLRERPEAALTVDRWSEDWDELRWVQILGLVTVLEARDTPGAVDALAAKYEQYRERRPGGPLLRLAPGRAIAWSGRELGE